MAKKKKKNSKKNVKQNNRVDILSFALIAIGIMLSVIMYTNQENLGGFIKSILMGGLMGKFAFALPIILILLGIYVIFKDFSKLKVKPAIIIIMILSITGLCSSIDYIYPNGAMPDNWFIGIGEMTAKGTEFVGGGLLGAITAVPLRVGFGEIFPNVLYIILLLVSTLTIFGIAFPTIIVGIFSFIKKVGVKSKEGAQNLASKFSREDEEDEEEEEYEEEVEEIPVKTKSSKASATTIKNKKFAEIMEQTKVLGNSKQISIKDLDLDDLDVSENNIEEEEESSFISDEEQAEEEILEETPKKKVIKVKKVPKEPKVEEKPKEETKAEVLDLDHGTIEDYSDYIFPPVSLLNEGEDGNGDYSVKELREVAAKLQKTLSSFNVDAKVVNVTHGPTVTQYEVQPNVGVKVSKILGLADDIALNLAAKSIRIEAPIPGKSAVGIEVPNKTKEMVTLREVIESDAFQDASSKVTFALGKSIDGEPCVSDIAKMPHLLIAGATGSGKSVCINSILVSLLYKAKPNEVKLIMIDPKRVELGVYNDIPHLLIPVVTDPKKAAGALNWAVQEMVNRYNLFAAKGVRDIRGYNDLLVQEGEDGILPQIVIIVDELADLMMVAPSEVEDSIVRLTQMARAAGMHLIIATQRPTVDVVTGIIKANVPSRIAFTVTSQVDSRTILDMAGAEKLLGKGDMLYYPIGESKPIRLQGTFVSDKEVEQIVDFVKDQNPDVKYNEDVIESFEKANQPPQAQQEQQDTGDELLPDAIELAVQMGNASASMLQRKFKIGYARAGRIIDQMEERGIVSGYDGSKPRQVLISKEEWEEMKEAGVDSVKYEDVDESDDDEYEYVEVDENEEEDEDTEYEYVEVDDDSEEESEDEEEEEESDDEEESEEEYEEEDEEDSDEDESDEDEEESEEDESDEESEESEEEEEEYEEEDDDRNE